MSSPELMADFRARLAEALPDANPQELVVLAMRLIYASRGFANGRQSALKDAQVYAGAHGLRVSACGNGLRLFTDQRGEFPIPE